MTEPKHSGLQLFAHPFSSYCQKVLIALYENDTAFQFRQLGPDQPATQTEFERLWPIKRMPLLMDGDTPVVESTIIIEHLQRHHPGQQQFLPQDSKAALAVRFMDRYFDNYVMAPQMTVVFNALRPADQRDPYGVAQARQLLDTSYAWLDARMKGRQWACDDAFSLADCAAAPSLFYADWTHRIPETFSHVHAYRRRLLARPSFARAVEEARQYRSFFPLGAPDRD